jgi:predicted metal-dependent phosphoesterase TrpH
MPDDDLRRRDALLRKAAQADREAKRAQAAQERSSAGSGSPAAPRDTFASPPGGQAGYRATPGPAVVRARPSRVDLHAHSCRSDGVLEPRQLVDDAAAAGLRVLALTDHDTVAGVRELNAPGQPQLPLQLLAGVEINSVAIGMGQLPEGELHILGLGVDTNDDYLESVLERQRALRVTRFNRVVDRLRAMGFPIDDQADQLIADAVATAGASLGRPQIARCMVTARYASSVDDAMKRFLARGRPAYVPREGLGPREAISAIRAAGGLPSLAHFSDAPVRMDLVRELAAVGLGGLEVHYRHFSADTVAQMAAVAHELKLLPTGGSDYHGDDGTYAQAYLALDVPDEDAVDLFAALGGRRHPAGLEALFS